MKVSATYGGGGVGVGIRWFQSDGTFISSQQSNITATTAWQKVEANLTAPALAAYGVGQCRNVSQTAGTAYWDNFTLLKKQSGAALIVSGTIQADQVEADFIDAFDINADNITAGSISADRLSIDGVTLDTDGAGNLIVGTAGIDTNEIKPFAVTIPTSVYSAAGLTIPITTGVWNDIQSLTFTSTGAPILITYAFNYQGTGTGSNDQMEIRLVHGASTQLYISAVSLGENLPLSASYLDTTATAGSRTFKLQAKINTGISSMQFFNRVITALEVKR